ncbi:hypothetical protein G7051_09010 [Dysgonomonas sp. HDW5B]|uniref:GIY-YIG nuclease family protein n=1 Tax=Dysgonomonas sp. HDW5B TaxID=2714927 RepID=UPI0014074424|nr:GIY-YIG nuclease family protein [Dysgonomonas sp. HDW5B]QIK54472.1 hypothetical protein G7051_09010 [Dysgonomonas sp. HDW5B]
MFDIFHERCAILDSATVLEFNTHWESSELHNVITGLCKECYGVFILDDKNIKYQLAYFNGERELEGIVLELDFPFEKRDKLVFFFSDFLSHRYKRLDTIDVFNTFQHYTRSMLERIGHLTLSSLDIEKYKDRNPEVIGALVIPMINKPTFYKDYFGNLYLDEMAGDDVCVYLMLNKNNNYIKIGKSKKPRFREKTLQAEEPDIEIIASWLAPAYIEKELHSKFTEKRMRGEWFDLLFSDLKIIKDKMSEYITLNNK